MKFNTVRIALAAALLAAYATAGGPPALAQDAIEEEVIVTGSYIKGSPEDAELPIDVVDAADLENLGSPSVVELVRHLGVTAANLGETNQFTTGGQANEGLATINLRGLGAARTLVLLNGRRHVATELEGVDIAAFPVNSIGRIEMLKDGAAAVYGSDAIGGVVNFITREGYDGFEVGGSYQDIDGSSGDSTLELLWGKTGDNWNFMLAYEHGKRGELQVRDRDWAQVSGDENNPGGWSGIAHPANIAGFSLPWRADQTVTVDYEVVTGTGASAMTSTVKNHTVVTDEDTGSVSLPRGSDPQCALLGAQRYPVTLPTSCGFNYSFYDNLIEETETNKLFGSFDLELSDNHRLHVEGLWSEIDLPQWKTSPSYPPQSGFANTPDRLVPTYHPGLQDFLDFYAEGFGNRKTPTRAQVGAGLGLTADDLSLAAGTTLGAVSVSESISQETIISWLDPSLVRVPEGTEGDIYPNAFVTNRAMGAIGAFGTGEPEEARRYTKVSRLSVGADGVFADGKVNYDASLAWSRRERDIHGQDMQVERMALALRGFGGPDCTLPEVEAVKDSTGKTTGYQLANGATAAGLAGKNGCEFYNPFSRAIHYSHVSQQNNPHYNPDVANSEELLRWLVDHEGEWYRVSSLASLNVVFSGEIPWELDGGTVGWAAGVQAREEYYESRYNDLTNRAINPCPFTDPVSVALGFVPVSELTPNCSGETGLRAFLSAGTEQTQDRTVYAIFGELALPVNADVDIQLALRYEDYGGNIGASVDPKIAINWRVTDEFSLRQSVSTTFRGPPQSILGDRITELQFVGPTLSFKAVDRIGNPDLDPEKAFSANVGGIYQTESFYGSVDWWYFLFEDSFQLEDFNGIVNAYNDRTATNPLGNDCEQSVGSPNDSMVCQQLRAQIFPVAAHTSLGAIQRIEVQWLNGSEIATSGIDFKLRYDLDGLLPGTLGFALDGTYLLEYSTEDILNRNGVLLRAADDLAGRLNYNRGTSFTSKPELKANFTVSFENAEHYASLVTRFISAYDHPNPPAAFPGGPVLTHLAEIDSHVTLDAHYRFTGLEKFAVGLSIINLADEDPPQARGDLNYDPYTHNPFGRMIKLDMTYRIRGE